MRQRKKLKKPTKQYPLNQCALYKIKGKGQLAKVLCWKKSIKKLEQLAQNRNAYIVWSDDGRVIQEAKGELKTIQMRIAYLLRQIEPPGYRHSGVPGRSFLTNALKHTLPYASVKTDIENFYPSIKFTHVYYFFHNTLKCAPDIAHLLASLCCYDQKFLPTGCVHSEVLAFYCLKPCFDAIHARTEKRGGVVTVYVDDIMLTMPGASHSDLLWMRKLFNSFGISLHGVKKSRVFRKNEEKKITGVIVHKSQVRAPQEQHLALKNKEKQLRDSSISKEKKGAVARSLLGHSDHIAQVERDRRGQAIGNRNRLKKVINQ